MSPAPAPAVPATTEGGAGPLPDGVLPPGVRDRAFALLQRAATALGALDGARWTVDAELADGHLVLPHVVAAANGLAPPPAPAPPRPAPGGGWVAVDLGPDDDETFRTFCVVIDDEIAAGAAPPDADGFARRAQEWRLAVTPYRLDLRRSATGAGTVPADTPGRPVAAVERGRTERGGRGGAGGDRPLDGVRIVDLTVMWAGPLVTWLADHLGAEVRRIEPTCRPDGLRAGPRPPGAGPGPGALHVALAGDKTRLDLDLRRDDDRRRFERLVAGADVVVDNLSPRVRPNLGIAPAHLASLRPGLVDVSITAFAPDRPEHDWVAYGGGVDAAAGTAARPGPDGGTVVAPGVVPHADPLTGFEVFAALVEALVARRRGEPHPLRITASLQSALDPLPRHRATGPVTAAGVDPAALAALTDWAGRLVGRTVVRDGCRVLPCPLRSADPGPARDPGEVGRG